MRVATIVGTWILTLFIGFIVESIIFQSLEGALLFSGIAALFSLPYLVIMIVLSGFVHDFWKMQFVHLILTLATALGLFLFAEGYSQNLFWLTFVYYGGGFLVQLFVYLNKNKLENSIEEIN